MKTDNELQRDVLAELKWDPRVDHSHIGVAAKDGVVTLSGIVPNYAEKVAAEKAAQRVRGVKAIAEEMSVKMPSFFGYMAWSCGILLPCFALVTLLFFLG